MEGGVEGQSQPHVKSAAGRLDVSSPCLHAIVNRVSACFFFLTLGHRTELFFFSFFFPQTAALEAGSCVQRGSGAQEVVKDGPVPTPALFQYIRSSWRLPIPATDTDKHG